MISEACASSSFVCRQQGRRTETGTTAPAGGRSAGMLPGYPPGVPWCPRLEMFPGEPRDVPGVPPRKKGEEKKTLS